MLELVVEKPCHHGFHIIWCISINGGYSGNLANAIPSEYA